jgi:hypothetical protein
MTVCDLEVGNFRLVIKPSVVRLPLICIYENPIDYPNKMVARLWEISKGKRIPTGYISIGNTLEDVRKSIPSGMVCIPRHEKDDPKIIECWI